MTRLSFSTNLTAADTERRVIAGRIVTWSETGYTSAGPARFEPGSIELADDVRLLREHDHTSPLGRSVSVREHEAGIDARFRIAATTAGTDALVEAAENLRDGLSVGVEVLESTTDDGVLVVTAARLDEVSLVAHPAIDSARVSSVAASEPQIEAAPEKEGTPEMNPDETVAVEESEAVEVVEASRPAPLVRTRPRVEFSTAGDYLATFALAGQGDRAASARLQAALADQVVGDNLGVVPTPIVGDLIEKEYGARPLINASRRLPMPAAGKSFVRPFVTQHTTVSHQGTELTELASQKMTIDPITVNKGTYGGALRISFQDRDWSSPEILNIVVGDLVRQYAEEVEAVAGVNLTVNATGTETINTATADSGALMKAIYSSAAKVNAATGMMPDTMYVAPDQWALIASKVDGNGRPLFPSIVPSNAPGTSTADSFAMGIAGLRVVVSNHLAAGTVIVGSSRYFETYENVGGALSATDPSVLGLTVAYYGYFANLVTIGGAFVKWASA